ncbi:hypothetical protein PUN4_570101 [Paraburkholderia unamae]|nr:hypothetical protein PUN4_570101 [Paraburkholderia unamae]
MSTRLKVRIVSAEAVTRALSVCGREHVQLELVCWRDRFYRVINSRVCSAIAGYVVKRFERCETIYL